MIIEINETLVDTIIDVDPSTDKRYVRWMIEQVKKGTPLDVVKDSVIKLWENKSVSPDIEVSTTDVLTNSLPNSIKLLIEGCEIVYCKNNKLVLLIHDEDSQVLELNPKWKKIFDTYQKDKKGRNRPIMVFINLNDLKKDKSLFGIFSKTKNSDELTSFLNVCRIGEHGDFVESMKSIEIPADITAIENEKERMINTKIYINEKNYEIRSKWMDITPIKEAFDKKLTRYNKNFYNKEITNIFRDDFWKLFPFRFGENPGKETEPWLVSFFRIKLTEIRKRFNSEGGYTPAQKNHMDRIANEMEEIVIHVKKLQEELYKLPKLPYKE